MAGIIGCSLSQINFPEVLIANGLGVYLMAVILLGERRRHRTVFFDGKLFPENIVWSDAPGSNSVCKRRELLLKLVESSGQRSLDMMILRMAVSVVIAGFLHLSYMLSHEGGIYSKKQRAAH